MAPGGEPLEDVGLDGDHHGGPAHAGPGDEAQGGPVAGAQIGNNQEGDKKHGGGAEIAHQGQTAHAGPGQDDEQPQVPFPEQAVQGGRSGKDVTDLGQLRGLEGQRPQDDPVFRPVFARSQQQRDAQQADGRRRHEPADLFGPLQIPQEDPQHQEEQQPQQDGQKLFGQGRGGRGGRDGQREGGEEKGHGLHFKADAPQGPQGEAVSPHGQAQAQKGHGNGGGGALPRRDDQLDGGHDLKQSQQHQPQPGGHRPLRPPPGPALLLLLRGDRQQHRLHAAQREHVAVLDGGLPRHRPAVDRHAPLGIQVIEGPIPVLPPDQSGVLAGDSGVVEHHV